MNIRNKCTSWLVVATSMWLAACHAPADRGVTITANIKGLEAGELIYYASQSDPDNSQTVVSENGGFNISIPIPPGQGDWYQIYIGASPLPDNIIRLYLDSGEVKITGTESGFKNVEFGGKPFTDDFNELRHRTMESLAPAKVWIAEHPASPPGTALLEFFLSNGSMPKDTIVALASHRDAASMNNLPAKRLQDWLKLTADIMPGKTAPDFTMADTIGKPISLSHLRGKYVLIDFWASWCGPCRVENPNVVKVFQQYKDNGFTVLGVSLDRPGNTSAWLAAIHKDQLQWTHVSDLKYWDNEAAKRYHITSIPANFLVDPKGVIIARDLRGEELQKKLETIFTE